MTSNFLDMFGGGISVMDCGQYHRIKNQ